MFSTSRWLVFSRGERRATFLAISGRDSCIGLAVFVASGLHSELLFNFSKRLIAAALSGLVASGLHSELPGCSLQSSKSCQLPFLGDATGNS